MVSLVNSHTTAMRIGWHLWEIDLRFALDSTPGWFCVGLPLCAWLARGYPWAVSRSGSTEEDPVSRCYLGGARRGPCARLHGGDAQPRRAASAPTGQKRGGAGRMSAGQTATARRGEPPSAWRALAGPVWRIARSRGCQHAASAGCSSSERRRFALRKARVDPGSSSGRAGRDLVDRGGREAFSGGKRERRHPVAQVKGVEEQGRDARGGGRDGQEREGGK